MVEPIGAVFFLSEGKDALALRGDSVGDLMPRLSIESACSAEETHATFQDLLGRALYQRKPAAGGLVQDRHVAIGRIEGNRRCDRTSLLTLDTEATRKRQKRALHRISFDAPALIRGLKRSIVAGHRDAPECD